MTTYVLVPGFWLGAWAWHSVTDQLRQRGHDVHPLSLTGMAERVHLASPHVTSQTHITDVVNLLRYEDLHDVVLVGHSYAGAVIVAAAAELAPERIAKLAFIDTGPLPDGMSQSQFADPEEQARTAKLVEQEGDGWRLPPPSWPDLADGVQDLPPEDLEALISRSVPQPWATATTPVTLSGAWESLPRLAVLSSFTEQQVRSLADTVPALALMGGDRWQYEELLTWHWPMFTRPRELAEILHRAG